MYSAYVLSNLDQAPYATLYRADWNLIPNLAGTALLMVLGKLVTWTMADKLVVLLASLTFIFGTRWLCRILQSESHETPAAALLGVPFALSSPLFFGFYSYSLGLALVPWAWGLAVLNQRRAQIALSCLLVAIWTCHAAACLVALSGATIFGWRRPLKHNLPLVVALTPASALLAMYVFSFPTQDAVYWEADRLLESVLLGRGLLVFDGLSEWSSLCCIAVIGLGAARSNSSMRALCLAGALGLVYALLPDGGSEHWFLSARLSLLPTFALIGVASRAQWPARPYYVLSTVVVSLHFAAIAIGYVTASDHVKEYVELEAHVPDGAHIVALDSLPAPYPSRHNPLLHAVGWVAIRRQGVDLTSYEPHRAHFQLKLQKYVNLPDPNRVMEHVSMESVRPYLWHADTMLQRIETPLDLPGFVEHEHRNSVHVIVKRDCKRHRH